jgi:hypothetical protein
VNGGRMNWCCNCEASDGRSDGGFGEHAEDGGCDSRSEIEELFCGCWDVVTVGLNVV